VRVHGIAGPARMAAPRACAHAADPDRINNCTEYMYILGNPLVTLTWGYMPRLPRARKRSYHITITLGGGVGPLPDTNAACRTAPHRPAPPPDTDAPVPSPAQLLLCARDVTGCRSLPTIALRCDYCAAVRLSRRRASASRASRASWDSTMGLKHG
jgi:hypothetical protein